MASIDYEVVDEGSVQAILKADPIALAVNDEALIAVAFAAVKLRGCCDPETRQLALKAIERERSAVLVGQWQEDSERNATLGLMADTLRRMPEALG